jgi:hypothetical protein
MPGSGDRSGWFTDDAHDGAFGSLGQVDAVTLCLQVFLHLCDLFLTDTFLHDHYHTTYLLKFAGKKQKNHGKAHGYTVIRRSICAFRPALLPFL